MRRPNVRVASLLGVAVALGLFLFLGLTSKKPADAFVPVDGMWVRITQAVGTASVLSIIDAANPERGRAIAVAAGVRDAAKNLAVSDVVRVTFAPVTGEIATVAPVVVTVGWRLRVAALVLGALTLLATLCLVLGGRLRWLVIGEDNRYSASKFQMAVWTVVIGSGYIAVSSLRWMFAGPASVGGLDVPTNVLVISGASVAGFAGAKQIVASQVARTKGFLVSAKTLPPFGSRFPRDLVTDDTGQRPDLGDIQMLLITLIAAGMYVVQLAGWLQALPLAAHATLPDIGGIAAGLFGAGQAAYLGKKLAGDTGANAGPGPLATDLPPKPPL
jgi:hypothetical protein